MPNKNYVKGRAFEYKIRDHYLKQGYTVFRTAGSHSVADLIVLPPLRMVKEWNPILVQCKATKGKGYEKEIAILKAAADTLGVRAVLATKDKKGKTIFIPVVQT